MNKIERLVYDAVKKNPAIKYLLRNAYQGFYDLLPHPANWSLNEIHFKENYFYGFHDCSPFSADESKLLAYHTTIPVRMPLEGEALLVGYFDLSSDGSMKDYHVIGESLAWNYHKGCRLQWVDDSNVIFNSSDGKTLTSTICSLTGDDKRQINWPIDSVSADGKWATSFSYGRLELQMPGYGYAIGDDETFADEFCPANTGLYLVDLQKNERKLLLSLKQLSDLQHEEDMADKYHFVTHTEFSPDGRYIAFLHRWYKGTFQRTRLVVYDLLTGTTHISPTSGMVSHYVWNARNGIVAYCRMEDIDSHVYFDSPTMREWKRCGYPKDVRTACLQKLYRFGYLALVSC